MEINNNSLAAIGETPTANTTSNQGSERDLFMSLLVAQLKNQDPLSPQEGTEFVAQLTQFNSLDQLINIRESIEKLANLVENSSAGSGIPTSLSGVQ